MEVGFGQDDNLDSSVFGCDQSEDPLPSFGVLRHFVSKRGLWVAEESVDL